MRKKLSDDELVNLLLRYSESGDREEQNEIFEQVLSQFHGFITSLANHHADNESDLLETHLIEKLLGVIRNYRYIPGKTGAAFISRCLKNAALDYSNQRANRARLYQSKITTITITTTACDSNARDFADAELLADAKNELGDEEYLALEAFVYDGKALPAGIITKISAFLTNRLVVKQND